MAAYGELSTHPATRTMRDNSICVERKRKERNKPAPPRFMMTPAGPEKIHRLFLNCETTVNIVNVVSPSCIWIKLPHHTTDNFDVRLEDQRKMRQVVKYDVKGRVIEQTLPVQFNYYLAPRMNSESMAEGESDIIYSRARLLEKKMKLGSSQLWCYMHFIDYGDGTWMMADCLAVMPKDLWSHPWQTIPVALFGLFPRSKDGINSGHEWSKNQCKILEELAAKYKRFIAKPVVSKLEHLNYNNYARVDITAIADAEEIEMELMDKNREEEDDRPKLLTEKTESTEKGDSAATGLEAHQTANQQSSAIEIKEYLLQAEFTMQCFCSGEPVEYNRDIDESSQQTLFPRQHEIPPSPRMIPETWRRAFPEFLPEEEHPEDTDPIEEEENDRMIRLAAAGAMMDPDEGDPDLIEIENERMRTQLLKWDLEYANCETYTHQVPELNESYLRRAKLISADGKLLVALNSKNRKSPYDFYGHFVKFNSSGDHYQELIKFYDDYIEWQSQLNSFYYLSGNCQRLDGNKIHEEAIREGGGLIYGIYGVPDSLERLNYMRVQVIGFNTSNNYEAQVEDYCWIRFIDCGGLQIVPRYTILRLHSRHAYRPPMCAQFCLSNILPKPSARELDSKEYSDSWANDQRDYFSELARTDTLMKCQLVGMNNEHRETLPTMMAPHALPDVVYIKDLHIAATNAKETIECKMVARGRAYAGTFLD